jgi:hypothetical protein
MTPLDAMYAARTVTFASRSFEGIEAGRRRNLSSIFRMVVGVEGDWIRLNEGAANDSFFS